MKHHTSWNVLPWLGGLLIFVALSAEADVNSWINSASGNWDDSASWSLGVLPDSIQSVMITNSRWKAVAINPSTPINFPGAMTISNLTIQGAWDTENTLLLNYSGTELPLTILNGLTLKDGAQIVNFSSGLEVAGGAVVITNSQIVQDGGFIRITNGMNFFNSKFYLTNGVFEAGGILVGPGGPSQFNQYGGSVTIADLNFIYGSTYALYGGTLNLPGGLSLYDPQSTASYLQEGGTNHTTDILLEPGLSGPSPDFTLNGGLLTDNNVHIWADTISTDIQQNGGTHVVSNVLQILGGTRTGTIRPALYQLNGGTLSASNIVLNSDAGTARYLQTGGTAYAQEIQSSGDAFWGSYSEITLESGTLSCSNLSWIDGCVARQSGGALVVSNLLNCSGWRVNGGGFTNYSSYTLFGGTLTASNINMGGDWIIGDSFASRITNAGTITLSHALVISNAIEQLGRFILPTNATINLAGEASKLSFADSSAEVWNSDAKLIVTNWNALTSGNYAGDALKFGTNQSGLTAAQLQRIHFINPAGFSPGDYAAQITGDGTIYPAGPASGDSTNDWTDANGYWHDLTWSLGVRPDSSQSVRIIGGNRTVTANATTAASYPESLTVHDLTVSGSSGTPSLILSNAGTATPLRVLNGLLVKDGATLANLNSGLSVDATEFTVTNAQVIQDGGFVRVTNATMRLIYGTYYMTNGVFEGGTVWAGTPYPALPGQFNQYGGSVRIAALALNNQYSLYGGTLDLPGGMGMTGRASGASYFQSGGTNRTPFITMWDGDSGGGPSLTLNGGLLAVGNVEVHSGWHGESTVTQNGGTLSITNALLLAGGATTGATVRPARYYLNGGALSARVMELNGNQGDAVFFQTNGTVNVETFYAQSVGYFGSFIANVTLGGGSLGCSNLTLDDGRGTFTQSGGALIVSNLLTITGYRDLLSRYYGQYNFTGGTVMASNINIAADWVIGDGTSNRISNPGFLSLSHLLQINNAVEQLGRFILATNATISLAGTDSKLSFANSSGETWTGGATLTVLNWNGNSSGGGDEQLKFGNNALGLTTAQLSQIRFVNPTGLPSGTYFAQILNTGEIVPTTGAALASERQGNNLVLNWPAGWTLQTATNVLGPYADLTTATSPYTNDMTAAPQAFFRLKQ